MVYALMLLFALFNGSLWWSVGMGVWRVGGGGWFLAAFLAFIPYAYYSGRWFGGVLGRRFG